ncbi:hypothetical protein HMP0721_2301 [Pseudoramibacter alactolyticus ATCC 23263]|uniref:Uncharacterized protein n=1 Tax=Pseudoramibacter alactolyticus ATCC 23263 TaxID=887929 RepID=E6MJW6_9FIRM|nr:hypothetical protein HMP0721_2301 [Pseudoramibacter alactolyticus ATCC 23263]
MLLRRQNAPRRPATRIKTQMAPTGYLETLLEIIFLRCKPFTHFFKCDMMGIQKRRRMSFIIWQEEME